jgi:hypothetical protein
MNRNAGLEGCQPPCAIFVKNADRQSGSSERVNSPISTAINAYTLKNIIQTGVTSTAIITGATAPCGGSSRLVATAAEDRLNIRRHSNPHKSFAAASDCRTIAIYECTG